MQINSKAVLEVMRDNIDDYSTMEDLFFNLFNNYPRHDVDGEDLSRYGVLKAVSHIVTYERDNFGEVDTDFSSEETVIDMIMYIIGEEAVHWIINSLNLAWEENYSGREIEIKNFINESINENWIGDFD